MSLPNPRRVAHCVLQLHSHVSPNGKFGFDMPTFDGIAPHPGGWNSRWRVFFTRLLRNSVETDAAANGVWPELSIAAEHLLMAIVPKVLDPLQEGPDPIQPRFIHGDLWVGNIGKDRRPGSSFSSTRVAFMPIMSLSLVCGGDMVLETWVKPTWISTSVYSPILSPTRISTIETDSIV